jgi:LAO/AO transport system kinase
VKTQASDGLGIDIVASEIERHRQHLLKSGGLDARRMARLRQRIRGIVDEELHEVFWNAQRTSLLESRATMLSAAGQTPYDVATEFIADFRKAVLPTTHD